MITVDLTHLKTLEEFAPEIRRLHEEDNDEYYCKLHDVLKDLVSKGMKTYKELGTNQGGTAAAAVLAGFEENIFIDLRFQQIEPYWNLFETYAKDNNVKVEFRETDSTIQKAVDSVVDVLLIDSLHKGQHLIKELIAHEGSVRYYICFHDTSRTGQFKDLYPVIEHFLNHRKGVWELVEHSDQGAGWTVIKRSV